ncbi:LOW QUALITY PROTEIN: uncharacterized protein LOC128450365 [Pleuronectes platessa]|uniref:LOW QUALITY PROTEIN: uncharacterized protein LOC128450365 n=1 Tax=Pleuronectes platessa TaxID=8262 RepID=UPI00232A276D|nr:LOW QUALITY PROTEIN: uncharacterized protein LOC128450365 [Pleuronectes platessa]
MKQHTTSNIRLCSECRTGYIMSDDLHPRCESCLGPEHAGRALTPGANCAFCKLLEEPERRRRAEAYAEMDGEGFASQRAFRLDDAIEFFNDDRGPESADSAPGAEEHYPPVGSPLGTEGSDHTDTPVSAQPSGIGALVQLMPAMIEKAATSRQLSVPFPQVAATPDNLIGVVAPAQPSLAAVFGLKVNPLGGRRPVPPSPTGQTMTRLADRSHQCAVQTVAAANNVVLLSHWLHSMSLEPHLLAETLGASIAVAGSRISSWQTLVHRGVWLERSNLSEGLRKELLEAPISPDGLFGPRLQTALEECRKQQMRPTGSGDTCLRFLVHRIPGETTGLLLTSGRGQLNDRILGGRIGTRPRLTASAVESLCAPGASAQPFRCEPPMGCSGESSDANNGGQGSGLARHHDNHRAPSKCAPPLRALLRLELQELLRKNAISKVPQGEETQGFYSRYFLVPKKTGGVRPILDLSLFNKSIMERRFHMLTIKQVLECVHQGDWFTSIDLKDAYFHVPIVSKHRRYLRFSFQGIQYQYNRLPFGYSLAPRTFSKCVETALEPLHRTGMRVLFYLDDLLLLARSREEAALQTKTLVCHLSSLGFTINWKKSSALPAQFVTYLGVELDSVSMRARLSQQRSEALTALLRRITPPNVVTVLSVMRLLGMMSAAHVVVPLGLLHMRRLQRWFIRLHVDPVRQRRRMVAVPPSVKADLIHWKNPRTLSAGVPLGRAASHISVFTDALELLTVWKVLQHFAPLLRDQHILVRTDNKATAAYINRQGGVRSAQLLNIARRLLLWTHTHFLSVRAVYIPGVLNTGADIMSRGGPRHGDWSLHPELVDLFASRGNAQCALWFSLSVRDNPPLGVDALAHRPWPRTLLYAFPPGPLIPRFLDRVREERLSAILVAPERTGASWFPCLQRLISGLPWELPWRGDALSQTGGAIRNYPMIGQRLWAWPLNGNI